MFRLIPFVRPFFSCVWLAGFALALHSQADERSTPASSAPLRIIRNQNPNAKSDSGQTRSSRTISRVQRTRVVRRSQMRLPENKSESGQVEATTEVPSLPQAASRPNSPRHHTPPELFRPLTRISLASAARSESTEGMDLRTPANSSDEFLSPHGKWCDVSGYRSTPQPARNTYEICYNPLYFEDPNLERCGVSYGCLTDMVSAVRFFGRAPLMPYMMGSCGPLQSVRSLGECRSCQEFGMNAYLPRGNLEGTGWQAACTVGLIFLIP